jgi:hypothetical protein
MSTSKGSTVPSGWVPDLSQAPGSDRGVPMIAGEAALTAALAKACGADAVAALILLDPGPGDGAASGRDTPVGRLMATVRAGDRVVPLGEREIAVVAVIGGANARRPDTTLAAILRRAVGAITRGGAAPDAGGIWVGCSLYPYDDRDPLQLLALARQALQSADQSAAPAAVERVSEPA